MRNPEAGPEGRAAPRHAARPSGPPPDLPIKVETMAFGGRGVARYEGLVVFVEGGFPGDEATVTTHRVRRKYAEASIAEIKVPSPHRTVPQCKHYGQCGGCPWLAMRYAAQLGFKEQLVRECLERIGGFRDFEIAPIRGADSAWRYRNKVEFSVGRDETGRTVVGFHPRGSWNSVLSISDCFLLPEPMLKVRAAVEAWIQESSLEPWDPRRRTGCVRHVTVRSSREADQIVVGITTSWTSLPGADDLVSRLKEQVEGFTGLCHARVLEAADIPTRRESHVVYGSDRLLDQVDHLEVELSLDAFFQTNRFMTPVLYRTVAHVADLSKDDVVWDLYCGVGSIGLYLAPACAAILGVEVLPAAVKDAERNAVRNGITEAFFLQGDARRVLKEILDGRSRLPKELQKPDVVVLDPPRGGLAKKVIARVAAAAPRRVVYVSCNPSTLASDLAQFVSAGYTLNTVVPVDMFPHTPHIEAVALLERD